MDLTSQKQEDQQLTMTYLSLSALLFFAPFVQHLLLQGHLNLTSAQQSFIHGYIRYGYGMIGLLCVALGMSIIQFFVDYQMIYIATQIVGISVIIGLCIGVIGIFMGKSVFQSSQPIITIEEVTGSRGDILTAYLPGYNVRLRYKVGRTDHPYRWLKESLLLRSAYTLIALVSPRSVIDNTALLLVLLRVIMIMSGLDVVSHDIKKHINTLFVHHIEELWCYPWAMILYIYHKITLQGAHQTYIDYLTVQQSLYQETTSRTDRMILTEYIITGLLISIAIIHLSLYGIFDTRVLIDYIPYLLLASLFVIKIRLNKLSPVPLIHECVQCFVRGRSKSSQRTSGSTNKSS